MPDSPPASAEAIPSAAGKVLLTAELDLVEPKVEERDKSGEKWMALNAGLTPVASDADVFHGGAGSSGGDVEYVLLVVG